MIIKRTEVEADLQSLIDKHGLTTVLGCIGAICGLKAQIAQDEKWSELGRMWDQAATYIEVAWANVRGLDLD